ncbi:MAG TPA: phosphatidylcholine/phosphatidylserine synthase [Acidimicrobiales bacterium]|nr:phosphatidylcholine/phosphatidylserine synthase [Acidimicrobiales bacterium]
MTTPRGASEMASGDAAGRRRRFRFRLVSPTGAPVVAPGRLDQRSRLGAMLPSLFTLVNLLCGFSSILASIDGQYRHAAALIAVAILFDIADGAVARAVGAITPFGLQFDSLADLTSFGMAPALLLYNRSLDDMYWVGWVAAGLWIACAAFRLARFNVTIDPHADKKYFIGLASPGAAGVVIATVFAFDPPGDGGQRWIPVLVAVVPALLMASSFRFRSFRDVVSPSPDRRWVTAVVGGAFALGLALAPAATSLVVAYGYVLSSPLGWATAPIRARLFGPDSVAPPRHRLPSVFFPESDEVEDSDADPQPPDPAGG